MATINFKQTPPAHLFAPFFNILAFLAPLYFLIRFAIRIGQTATSVSASAWLISFSYGILLAIVLLITANYFCEVTVDEAGISVTFLWRNLHINWRDIVEIKAKGFLGHSRSWVVLTKKLTPFHRLYGIVYGFSWLPGFIISPSLHDGEKLAGMIEERVKGRLSK